MGERGREEVMGEVRRKFEEIANMCVYVSVCMYNFFSGGSATVTSLDISKANRKTKGSVSTATPQPLPALPLPLLFLLPLPLSLYLPLLLSHLSLRLWICLMTFVIGCPSSLCARQALPTEYRCSMCARVWIVLFVIICVKCVLIICVFLL